MKNMTDNIVLIMRLAGKAIMEIYRDEKLFLTETKEDQSPLTAADRRSNEIILEGLNRAYPGIPVVSEESKQIPYSERSGYHRYFLVDPLDGTKEFIKRNGEFTVNIAYMEDSRPVGGYVLVPVTGMSYVAGLGEGAFRIDPDGNKEAISSAPFFLMQKGIRVFASRSHRDERTERMMSMLNDPEIMSAGSSLKFLRIAEGSAHFYPRRAPTMEWDTAAAQCILEESGGSVLSLEDLLPLRYNKENLLNPHFIALGSLLDPESLRDILTQPDR